MSDPSTPGGLSSDVRQALIRQITTLADSKRILGIRYSDWLLGAPSIETGVAVSSMAQDEWGHARLLYSLLKDLGLDPVEVERDRAPEAYANLGALDGPVADWAEVVAVMVAVDTAISAVLECLAEGAYEPARARAPKMLAEEVFHRDLGLAWFRRLASGSEEASRRLAESLAAVLPGTLAWLDPEDETHRVLVEAGLLMGGARLRYSEQMGAAFEGVGVALSSIEPDRAGWDEARGRGPGHPEERVVEQARGDRNRALFVE